MKSIPNEREYYLADIPLKEAIHKFDDALHRHHRKNSMESEHVSLSKSVGRVVSKTIYAKLSSPLANTAAMDGIAVKSSVTVGATESAPVTLIAGRDFQWVDTGDAMPDGADSVVMVEEVGKLEDESVLIRSSAPPYQHVRRIAEDIASPEILMQRGSEIRILDIAALAAGGYGEVLVRKKPKVAILPTGNELVPVGYIPEPGQVIEFNSIVVSEQVRAWGGLPTIVAPVPDLRDEIVSKLTDLSREYDVVVVLAGSSAGSEDFTASSLSKIGSLLLHGVAVRPGHPIILGFIKDIPVIGLPGYPSSTVITSEIFLKMTLGVMLGMHHRRREQMTAVLSRKTSSPMGEDEFIRVTLGKIRDQYIATPVSRGAAMTLSMARSDGIAHIPSAMEGIDEGAEVSVELVRTRPEIDNTLLLSGSDDIALHLLSETLSEIHDDVRLVTSSVGSVGGLVALAKGYAHLAGSHLLDSETGLYNEGSVRRLLPNENVYLIDFVGRTQGLILQKENPKNIKGLSSLFENDCIFINRQRGSGTRLFLDFKLGELGVSGDQIRGYQNEEYTHWAVAASVSSGYADVGIGIKAAAVSNGLEFIPLGQEKYQLVVPEFQMENNFGIPKLLDLLDSSVLRNRIEQLGGYDVSTMGASMKIGDNIK